MLYISCLTCDFKASSFWGCRQSFLLGSKICIIHWFRDKHQNIIFSRKIIRVFLNGIEPLDVIHIINCVLQTISLQFLIKQEIFIVTVLLNSYYIPFRHDRSIWSLFQGFPARIQSIILLMLFSLKAPLMLF